MRVRLLFFFLLFTSISMAQVQVKLQWQKPLEEELAEGVSKRILHFAEASYLENEAVLPYFYVVDKNVKGRVKAEVLVLRERNPTQGELNLLAQENIPSKLTFWVDQSASAGIDYTKFYLLPFYKKGQSIKVIEEFEYRLVPSQNNRNKTAKRSSASGFARNSVLNQGNWFKLRIAETDVYRVTYSFLAQNIGDASFPIQNLRLFGNGTGMLPESNSAVRKDDLQEVPIKIFDINNDGIFNAGDYFLFYGKGPHQWTYVASRARHNYHRYSEFSYYFLSFDYTGGLPKRVNPTASSTANPAASLSTFLDHQFHETESVNLVNSGRNWFGEQLGINNNISFNFNFPNAVIQDTFLVEVNMAARSTIGNSSFSVTANGTSVSQSISSVPNQYSAPFGRDAKAELRYRSVGNLQTVNIGFNQPNPEARAWVDYIEIQGKRNLITTPNPLHFRNLNLQSGNVYEYAIQNNLPQLEIWDVTEHNSISQILPVNNNANPRLIRFSQGNEVRQFVAFDPTSNSLLLPEFVGEVENQNLHELEAIDYLILTHPLFTTEALRLADFHRNEGLSVEVVEVDKIYNEFSSGAQDITAIKDFMRMLYERGQANGNIPKYLLLFGDASYDYKSISSSNTNYVPTFQSPNSLSRTNSYLSDDYFGLLDSTESASTSDIVDIGIGRFPVRTQEEARNAVDKTIFYYRKENMGPWRNFIAFIGDDEDRNIHMRDADSLALRVESRFPNYNIDKIYFDAYQQVSTPGGNRYPEVERDFINRVERGALIVSYIGHGGELGLAHERVLEIDDINSWENKANMPLFVTATCEFTRFDDPKRTSAGEYVFLNPDGGGIGLLTTTRLVYSTPNYQLSKEFNNIAYDRINGETPTLGDLNRLTKAKAPGGVNSRCFALIGDPALKLAYPQLRAQTTEAPDSIRPLEKVTFKGFVSDINGTKLTDYNGVLQPTVFDKVEQVQTLNNDGAGVFSFELQNSIIFRGKASVTNGEWEFSFVAPKDISVIPGEGRASYYTQNGVTDGTGYSNNFVVGGFASDAIQDNTAPDVALFMNDENFVSGGLTDENPDLLARFFDENGINTVGNGVGHDIVAVLDDDTQNPIILNDFYESEIDSFQRGTIRYPLKDLSPGTHTLKLTAWDVFNNPASAEIEFVVAEAEQIRIDHVLNYPNPFTTYTEFHFDHNQPGQLLDVRIQLFTISGKLVKTIDHEEVPSGFKISPIPWDGRDDFGDKIGRGVYVYHLRVRNAVGETAEKYEKLVLLD